MNELNKYHVKFMNELNKYSPLNMVDWLVVS